MSKIRLITNEEKKAFSITQRWKKEKDLNWYSLRDAFSYFSAYKRYRILREALDLRERWKEECGTSLSLNDALAVVIKLWQDSRTKGTKKRKREKQTYRR